MAHMYKKKRLPRYKFESSDRTLLQNLVNKYIGILELKATNQNMLDEKKRTWQIITQKFNSKSVDKRVRDAKQLRKCWENMKWRARRELRIATGEYDDTEKPSDYTHSSPQLASGLAGVEMFMNGDYDDEDEEDDMDDNEGEDDEDGEEEDEEEEEIVAPMGTEPVVIDDESQPPDHTNGNGVDGLLISTPPPPSDPRMSGPHPISHPPDDELIGSLVADAWIAEEGAGPDDDREAIHIKTEIAEVEQSGGESQIWNGISSSPARSVGGGSSCITTRTPPPSDVIIHEHAPRAPSVSSSAGDAAESLSSRHSASSTSRSSSKRPRLANNHTSSSHRASPAVSMVLVDNETRGGVAEAERQLRAEEEHTKKLELLQAQLDYEKSKVERMRRMMEMSEIEHRARMRMLVRYQQVAEKQKEYWSKHADNDRQGRGMPPPDLF